MCFLQSAFTSAALLSFRGMQGGSESATRAFTCAESPDGRLNHVHVCCLGRSVSPGDSHTLGVAVLGTNGLLQLVQLSSLLQLLHQALNSLFTPLLLLPSSSILLPDSPDSSPCTSAPCWSLLPAQKTFHYWRSERKDGGHGGTCV